MSYFWSITAGISTLLQVLVIAAMQRRSNFKQYTCLFFYCVVLFLSGVVETAAILHIWPLDLSAETYANYYWTNEAILQFLIFCVMLALIHRSLEGSRVRAVVVGALVLALLLLVGVSLWTSQTAIPARRLTEVSRNLSFLSALLNLVLWSALIRRRRADPLLLMVAAGIGVQTTGKAIGHSLRVLGKSAQFGGNLVVVASHLLCLFIWWWAFSRQKRPVMEKAAGGPVSFDPRMPSE